jgi:hypothetical protein
MSTHVPDPHMRVDLSQTTMQQAQATALFNLQVRLRSALNDLERVKRFAGRGNKQAAYDGYNRVYANIERIARAIYEATGEESVVPKYDPPEQYITAANTVKIGAPDPFKAPETPPPPRKKIPKDIKPGTRRWYTIQGQTPPEGCPE